MEINIKKYIRNSSKMQACKSGAMEKTEVPYADLKLLIGSPKLMRRMLYHGEQPTSR